MVHRDERARRRLGPGCAQDVGSPRRWRLRGQRPEDLDQRGGQRRLLLRDLPHQQRGSAPQGSQRADRADGPRRHRGAAGARHGRNSHFCEIFFTDVRLPAHNLVGTEGGAFKQTMVQLGYERGGIDRLVSNRPLYELALEHADLTDPRIRQKIAAIETGYRLGRLMVYRGALDEGSADYSAGTKAFCTEHEQRVAQFAAQVLGPAATVGDSVPTAICYAPAYTIQGGTSAIMRNIVGERLLGLPREPR